MKTAPLVMLLLIAGCSTNEPPSDRALAGVSRAEQTAKPSQPAAAPASERPPVIMDKAGIPAAEINERLAEAAGSVVLEEVLLDRALAKLITERNVTVTRRDVDAERAQLLRSMQEDAKLTPAQAELMLENVRRSRGLGPVRFEALLARNAQLRALVRPEVEVSNEDLQRAVAIEFGPAYRARVIRTATQREASQVRSAITTALREPIDLRKTPEEREAENAKPLTPEKIDVAAALFAQWAVKSSTQETAPHGGLIPEFSPADETYPAVVRQSLTTLKPGVVSEVFDTADGAWLVLVEKPIATRAPATDADREQARARLTARRERLEMDRLARQLLAGANVTVLDPGLRWSWEARPQ